MADGVYRRIFVIVAGQRTVSICRGVSASVFGLFIENGPTNEATISFHRGMPCKRR